jgi:hypothetical protein
MGRRHDYEWLFYIHGANGSGKSTLARSVMTSCGGAHAPAQHPKTGALVTRTRKGGLSLIGKYTTATGGVDTVHPYVLAPKTAVLEIKAGQHVLMEGLMTPGIETLTKLRDYVYRREGGVMFIHLNVSLDDCIAHVMERRERKGKTEEFDPRNVIAKHKGAIRWLERLHEARLPVYSFDWDTTRDEIVRKLGVISPETSSLLD